MQFYLSIKSNKFGTKHFFYTYEYTLDLIFKEFAGYFTILIVVNLIFKTEESWKFEEKKMCGRFFGKVMFWSGVWKSEIMVGRPELGWNYSRKVENWPKSRISTEMPRNDGNRHKKDLNRPKNDENRHKNNENRSENWKSTEKPKIDRNANNLPKIRIYHRENWNYDQNCKIDQNGYND